MPEQLNLIADGAQPADLELGRTQRAVMRVVRRVGELSRDEVGAIIHAGRGKHGVDDRCMFCGVDADGVIESLIHRQLVEKSAGGVRVAVTKPDQVDPAAADDGIPY